MKKLSLYKNQFPIVLASGICGVGKSTAPKDNAFLIQSFNGGEKHLTYPADTFQIEKEPSSLTLPPLLSTETFPKERDFKETICNFQSQSDLEKVVLARKKTFTFAEGLPIYDMLSLLVETFPCENVFAYIPNETEMFFGTSPENLYTREGGTLLVDCIAGTTTKEEAKDLFSTKHKKEHRFITTFVEKEIAGLAKNIQTSPLYSKDAANLVHLYQTVTGKVSSRVTDAEIIEKLHPTPATCGSDRSKARAFLEEHESFDRGLYAGIMGWVSPNKTKLKVNLRCGHIEKNRLTLFAGAGITSDSVAEKEVAEIENKFQTLEGVLFENAMSK